jgi:hypothetical protein
MKFQIHIAKISGRGSRSQGSDFSHAPIADFQGVVVDNDRDGEIVFLSELLPSEQDARRSCRDYINSQTAGLWR